MSMFLGCSPSRITVDEAPFKGLLYKGCLPSRPETKLDNPHKGLQRAGHLLHLTASPQRMAFSLQTHFSFPPCLCPREVHICRNMDPDPKPVCPISFGPHLVGGTHVDPRAPGPQGHCEGQYLHLGAQKAVVSALRACQTAHVFGGQLGAWRISGMGEPGGLPSMGLHRVGHD